MRIKPITVEMVEYIAHHLAKETMQWNEPLPEFKTRFPQKLESCLAVPFQTFSQKHLYQGLAQKGAALFYLIIKNHPFQNGNKRMAVTTLILFLYVNKKWLEVDTTELYNFAVWVAQSPPQFKDEVMQAIEKFIKQHLIDGK